MTVFLWSQTAANNDDIDSSINWQEGQSPGSINGSARAMMAAIAKWRDDMSGNSGISGTATALTYTSNQTFTSLTDGIMFVARMGLTNGTAPTLAVDGLTAKPVANIYGEAIGAGVLRIGSIHTFTYDTAAEQWIVHGAREKVHASGDYKFTMASTPATGWLISNGRTVGNASSNATLRANADTEDLFAALWNNHSNTEAPIYTSGGVASTRGATAAADYAANKAIATINWAGRVPICLDNLGIGAQSVIHTFVTSEANGKLVGAQGVALTEANLAEHDHDGGTITIAGTFASTGTDFQKNAPVDVSVPVGAGNTVPQANEAQVTGTFTQTGISGSTANAGSGTQHSNIQPGVLVYCHVKL